MPVIKSSDAALSSIESTPVVYRAKSSPQFKPSTLVVDYNLSKIVELGPPRWACCEIEDLPSGLCDLTVHVDSHDSFAQIDRDLCAASSRLASDGGLHVLVPARSGASRIEATLKKLFHQVLTSNRRGAYRFDCGGPTPSRFSGGEQTVLEYRDALTGRLLRFTTRAGLFSWSEVDAGTQFLLSTLESVEGRTILDVGCGYGVVGAVLAVRGANVTMLDVDARAVKATQQNLELNELQGNVILADGLGHLPENAFDQVVSNPPTHAGSQTLQRLFHDMVRVAGPSGCTVMVLLQHLNYEKWLRKIGATSTLAASEQYKVLEVRQRRSVNPSGAR